MNFAAGIIPYCIENGELYFLLGLEKSNNKWSGFVGNKELKDMSVINTAIREFNEETTNIFYGYSYYLRLQILTKKAIQAIDYTSSNKTVYLYFINFPKIQNLELNFINKREYQEKLMLRWFSFNEIKTRKDIFTRLRKEILRIF